jgi:hypothetical protein
LLDDIRLLAELAVGEVVEPHPIPKRSFHVRSKFLKPEVMRRIFINRR